MPTCANPLHAVTWLPLDLSTTLNIIYNTIALPSIAKTVECEFRYTVFLGFDADDSFFESAIKTGDLMSWYDKNVRVPLRKGGIDMGSVHERVSLQSTFKDLASHRAVVLLPYTVLSYGIN